MPPAPPASARTGSIRVRQPLRSTRACAARAAPPRLSPPPRRPAPRGPARPGPGAPRAPSPPPGPLPSVARSYDLRFLAGGEEPLALAAVLEARDAEAEEPDDAE